MVTAVQNGVGIDVGCLRRGKNAWVRVGREHRLRGRVDVRASPLLALQGGLECVLGSGLIGELEGELDLPFVLSIEPPDDAAIVSSWAAASRSGARSFSAARARSGRSRSLRSWRERHRRARTRPAGLPARSRSRRGASSRWSRSRCCGSGRRSGSPRSGSSARGVGVVQEVALDRRGEHRPLPLEHRGMAKPGLAGLRRPDHDHRLARLGRYQVAVDSAERDSSGLRGADTARRSCVFAQRAPAPRDRAARARRRMTETSRLQSGRAGRRAWRRKVGT